MPQFITRLFSTALPGLILTALMLSGCRQRSPQYRTCEGSVWSTTYHITYSSITSLDEDIARVFAEVDSSLSAFNPLSTVSLINRNESNITDSLFRRCFNGAKEVNRLSAGAFDPTLAPLINLWGFGYMDNGADEPTEAMIDSARRLVGIDACVISDNTLLKPNALMQFNFSAIAKGLACDLISEMFRAKGCNNYMIEIGGEIALSGVNPRGNSWKIMIDAPIDYEGASTLHSRLGVIELAKGGMATSGNYRNYRQTASGRKWHTISPVTGYPAVTEILSATVIAPSAMMADALATACMTMDAHSAMAMIDSIGDVEALIVLPDTMLATTNFPKLL